MAHTVCGVHLGSVSLGVLAVRPAKRGWMVVAGAQTPAPPDAEEDLGPAVKALFKSLKAGVSEVTLSLPKQQAIVRNVLLPSTEREELEQMARFEAERHIPFHAERHAVGFHVMRSMGVEGSEVVLGAVDGPVVQRAIGGVLATGVTLGGVTLSSIALVNSLLLNHSHELKGITTALLSIGLDTLDLVLMTDGRLIFARSATLDLRGVLEVWAGWQPGGAESARPDAVRLATAARMINCLDLEAHYGQGASPAPTAEAATLMRGWFDRLQQEIKRTYDFARREMHCPPIDRVIVTGEGSMLRNLDEYLNKNLSTQVTVLNPVAEMEGYRKGLFAFEGREFVLALGAAAGHHATGAYRLDLTPPEHYRHVSRRRTMRQLVITGILLLFTLGLGVASWMRYSEINARQVEAYESINRKMRPVVAELEEMQIKRSIIRNFLDDPNSALVVLNSISESRVIPDRVSISRVMYEKNEEVEIDGDAISPPDLSNYTQDLRASGHFAFIDDPKADPTQMFGQQYYTFKLTAELAGQPELGSEAGGNDE